MRHLLGQTGEILTPTKKANGFGTPVDDWTTPAIQALPCRLQHVSGAENNDGRDLSIGQWKVFFPPEAVIDEHRRVRVDGKTFEVVTVYPVHTPRGLHHFEVELTTFSGGVPSG